MRINSRRLMATLDQMAEIGRTDGGGVTRLALSDEDRVARDLLATWMEEAHLEVKVDDFGNMTGVRPGSTPGALPVRIGSHLDSVRRGGRFDGALGVLGALEVIRTLNDADIVTEHPIEIANWTNEEGARFEPAMLCSGAVVGHFTKEYVYSRTDADGLTFGDELVRIGYQGEENCRPGHAHGYLELHVEQGPILDTAEIPVGIVEGIIGITWCQVVVEGRSDHAGPTPMNLRHDALVSAAELVKGVGRLARELDDTAVGTVGRLAVHPNIINVIPDRVVFSVDFRHRESSALDRLVAGLEELGAQLAQRAGTPVTVERFWTSEPVPFDADTLAVIKAVADDLGLAYDYLWSGAGHDARYMQDVCPSAMIFVRSRGGLSHTEQEFSAPEDIEAGVNLLLNSALKLAGGVPGAPMA